MGFVLALFQNTFFGMSAHMSMRCVVGTIGTELENQENLESQIIEAVKEN